MASLKHTSGQSMTEYILIGCLVAIVAIGALGILGNSIFGTMSGILGSGKQKPSPSSVALSSQGSLSNAQASPLGQSLAPSAMSSESESNDLSGQGNGQTVLTTGSNGNLLAFQNNMTALQAMYDEQDDPEFKALLAQLLRRFSKKPQSLLYPASGGGSPVAEAEEVTYTLGEISVISQAALPGLSGSITAIQGSPQFAQLSAADQQQLIQIMQDLQTQAQYFVNAENQ